jgi:hypothetical protein
VIGFGLRLAIAGGRDAVIRFAVVAAAIALGAGLLLATLAGVNAVKAQNARYAWLNTGITTEPVGPAAADPLWWLLRGDYYHGQPIGRVDLAATGPRSPVPPGIPALPGPGEFYASPALSDLLAAAPPAELADRYPGRQVGVIGPAALPAPNALIIIVGHTPAELSSVPGAQTVARIGSLAPGDCDGCLIGTRTAGMELILSVVAGALLFPLLIFVSTATRLAAARREQCYAAMRLVGATPRQVSMISAVESTAAAVAGTAVGFGLFLLLRRPLAAVPFTGAPFYPADLSLSLLDVVLVGLGVPAGAAAAARIALRRVHISPLGVSRRVTPRPPRAYRLIPLLAGLSELAFFIGRRPSTTEGQVAAFLSGFLLTMVGLVIAGPWLTMIGARVLARRSRRPASLIAARRLADSPRAGFRAVSGLVLALFVTSVAIGVITTIVANRGVPPDDTTARTRLTQLFSPEDGDSAAPDALTAELRRTPGVRSVTVLRANPVGPWATGALPGLVACADLAQAPSLGHCADGAAVAQMAPQFSIRGPSGRLRPAWPSASVSAAELARLPVLAILVDTSGATSTLERARTALERAYPAATSPPFTEGDFGSDFTRTLTGWRQLANVVILASLPIAGCSLAVSVAGGLSDRRRPFSLLRLSGVPLGVVRRVVALETAVPLLVVSAVAIGTGFVAADLFLRAQMEYTLRPPAAEYYLVVLAGLAVTFGIIAATLPLLERMTGPENARNG